MLLLCLRILAVASVALYLIPTGTHLFELPAKMTLAPDEYMVTQGIYRGWSLFGIVVFAALLLVLLHSVLRRARRSVFVLSLVALVCLIGTQVIFWLFTYPMNVATANWTTMPADFEMARRQWEFSHAASAVLTFLALIAITASVLLDASPRSHLRTE
jgi:hypothetical protein